MRGFFLGLLFLIALGAPAQAQNLPSLDEYKNVKQGLLLPDEKAETPQASEEEENAIQAMSIEDILKAYSQGKYELVVKYFMPLAKNGHPQGEEIIGIMYRRGQGGLQKSPEQAIHWLSRAAESNRPRAQHYLGIMSYLGEGLIADPVKALMWIYIAIAHYENGPERDRAIKDRDNIYARLSRRDKERAQELAHDWLDRRNEAYLLDVR